MKKGIISCILMFVVMGSYSQEPLRGLVGRILPGYEDAFVFDIDSVGDTSEMDFFEIATPGDQKVHIRGNTVVNVAAGLNWYLKYHCGVSFSWSGSQSVMPAQLPLLDKPMRVETPLKVGFYLNYCTFSYSMPFWGWSEWEREIDRMVLNGINTPMAMVGVESVWRNMLLRFGYSREEISRFLPSTAYLGWFLMGNLEGMGGPVSDQMIRRQEQLQLKILDRMREYGMQPVFQSFFGMVPASLRVKYPEADVLGQGRWMGFERPMVLNPIDPLFDEMAKAWYEEYEKLYGSTRYYAGDLFHEGGRSDNIDLLQAGSRVQQAMLDAVPNSVWVLQSWGGNPRQEMLLGLSKENTLIVDLCAEYWDRWRERRAFDEFPWIWGNINNWGGNTGLHGRLDAFASEPIEARQDSVAGRWLRGTANVPEGTGTNPLTFDLACEMRFRGTEPKVSDWLRGYAKYRYGQENKVLEHAWQVFYKTAYGTYKGHRRPSESFLCATPSLRVRTVSAWSSTTIYYDPAEFEQAVRNFASVYSQFKDCNTYEFDLIDFTRQVVANKARLLHADIVRVYNANRPDSLERYCNKFEKLLLLQDELLSYREEFSLVAWIEAARAMSADEQEKDLMEYNARMLLTTWSDTKSELRDYAHREWSGLLRDYYLPRWKLFFYHLKNVIGQGRMPDPEYYPMERAWTLSRGVSPLIGRSDLSDIVQKCLDFSW